MVLLPGRYLKPIRTNEIISAGTPIAYLLAGYGDTGLLGPIRFETAPVPLPSALGLFVCGLLTIRNAARIFKSV